MNVSRDYERLAASLIYCLWIGQVKGCSQPGWRTSRHIRYIALAGRSHTIWKWLHAEAMEIWLSKCRSGVASGRPTYQPIIG